MDERYVYASVPASAGIGYAILNGFLSILFYLFLIFLAIWMYNSYLEFKEEFEANKDEKEKECKQDNKKKSQVSKDKSSNLKGENDGVQPKNCADESNDSKSK